MERTEYIGYIIGAFKKNGLGHLIDDDKANKFYDLSELLVETNKITNLTAITEQKAVILKHFVDCATVCDSLEKGCKLLDVGCGAGFPSLPVAILRDDVSVSSIDSTGKKIAFVNRAAEALGLNNITAECCRAEDFVRTHRESFDACTSRAVARLNILSELCLPFVKIGGRFIAMKSERGSEEYAEAEKGILKLGGEFVKKIDVSLSLEHETVNRELYVVKKTKNTPIAYPRNYSQIVKKPL